MKKDQGSIFTIPAGCSFLDSLASNMVDETNGDFSSLSEFVVLLPTRRACRALRDSFLRILEGAPTVLPTMQPIGDSEETALVSDTADGFANADLPPAMPDTFRILALAKRIQSHKPRVPEGSTHVSQPDQALLLARELAGFLDLVQTERLDFASLSALVPDDLAMHWQETLGFLCDFTENWPLDVKRFGFLEPAERRNKILNARVQHWKRNPPSGCILAAGSTGSIPATSDLLATVASMPRGRVILPGLDLKSDEENWAAISKDSTHPQFGMARLLDRLKVKRKNVAVWGSLGECETRSRLILEAMRPATMTVAWQNLRKAKPLSTDGINLIECSNEAEEAGIVALLLRKQIEVEGKTAALVTSDRRLARRVAMALKRWNIDIDDSAGMPLAETFPAIFMRLIAEMIAEKFSPVSFLALGKHPLSAAGFNLGTFLSGIRKMDKLLLRGPKPSPGIAGIRDLLSTNDIKNQSSDIKDFLLNVIDEIGSRCQEMTSLDGVTVPLDNLVNSHIKVAESLAQTEAQTGAERLWAGVNGEALAKFFSELRTFAGIFSEVSLHNYPAVLNILMRRSTVRPRYGMHPRLNVWGPLEARLQTADCVVLAGLNEGNWPLEVGPDPWFSRPMRRSFGLPPAEQRIGLSAHDFSQLLAAPEVFLTRSRKVDGTPTVPTRWLSRIKAVLRASGQVPGLEVPDDWACWQVLLDRPDSFSPIEPPAPRPPVSVRPKKLSVTQIETLMRDPYGIYARHIIGLKKLEPLEADPGASQNGIIVHAVLDRYISHCANNKPTDELATLIRIGKEVFDQNTLRPSVKAFWWPRFCRIAEWFVEFERKRRSKVSQSLTERCGSIRLQTKYGSFELTARVDRIDQLVDGKLEIIDYKTGGIPSRGQVEIGLAPQLPLEAVITNQGGFEGLDGVRAPRVSALSHWKLTGGDPAGIVQTFETNVEMLAEEALAGVQALVEKFNDPSTPYSAIPVENRKPRHNDYAHLERILEWSSNYKK